MTQKKKKNNSNRLLLLLEAPKIQKKKRSLPNRKRAKRFCQISISNAEEKFKLSRCKQNHVQVEITLEILSSLPVRSLQRFRCVSRFWEALISDPYVKKKHLNHANNDQNSHKLLICQMCWGKDDRYSFYHSSLSLSSDQVFEDEQELDCPSNCKPVCSMILCSHDGLVLLRVSDRIDKQLLLWNPSTRESVVLPHPESTVPDCVFGLGYDTISRDYKILSINLNAGKSHNISVEILALKSGSWRKIGQYPTGVHRVVGFWNCGMDYLAFVHGGFHWLGQLRDPTRLSRRYTILSRNRNSLSQNYTIISFNISNEVYGEIPLLERMFINAVSDEHGVSVLRGMLCLYSTYEKSCGGTFQLWAMKNYGVKKSWSQLLTIQGTNLFYSAKPKYMFVNGEVLLRCKHLSSGYSVYRTSRGPFEFWPPSLTAKQVIVYTESLISPRICGTKDEKRISMAHVIFRQVNFPSRSSCRDFWPSAWDDFLNCHAFRSSRHEDAQSL